MRRPLAEIRDRWKATQDHSATSTALQKAVTQDPPSSPCVAGCRSVCWKAFLLFRDCSSAQDWAPALRQARASYEANRNRLLRYIKHPEQLAAASSDPLADDPDSPWNSAREDEAIRAEIEQDVRRLPDEPFYHLQRIQALILDVLFVWCRLHPRTGGYRQGMHELLAPIVLVLEQDSVAVAEHEAADSDSDSDATMAEILDASFVEHDAYALFGELMQNAGDFYHVNESDGFGAMNRPATNRPAENRTGAIIEKSRYIHEHCLARVDPELADHLRNIEILPQIFLIRWIRLIFGREFPLDQLLILWDVLFAVDPSLGIVDLVCVCMLVRIRWSLIEADYSVALQLLLKYPVPEAPHNPYTFIDDALYLQSHMTPAGGSALMLKYSGRMPLSPAFLSSPSPSPSPIVSRTGTPNFPRSVASRAQQHQQHRSSPLPSPSRFIQHQGGVEALFQGAARNVLERGERLGINQAVRDAMGEIRRNVQTFQEKRSESSASGFGSDDLGRGRGGATAVAATSSSSGAMHTMEKRNRMLARMLDETVSSLQALSRSDLGDTAKTQGLIEAAAARVLFVKVFLEDSTMDVPPPPEETPGVTANHVAMGDVAMGNTADEAIQSQPQPPSSPSLSSPIIAEEPLQRHEPKPKAVPTIAAVLADPMDLSADASTDRDGLPSQPAPLPPAPAPAPAPSQPVSQTQTHTLTSTPSKSTSTSTSTTSPPRPDPPVPTRSSLAQSSFSWMLEPDETTASAPPASAFPALRRSHASAGPVMAGGSHKKKPSAGGGAGALTRERNAFLFGEVTSVGEVGMDGTGTVQLSSDEIFGLQPLHVKRRPAAADG